MHRFQRSVFLALVLLPLLALAACGSDKPSDKAGDKKPVTLSGEGFTVEMPGKAQRTVSTLQSGGGPLKVTTYISEGGEEGFTISVFKLPPGGPADLAAAIKGAAINNGGTAKDSRKVTYQGYNARDARVVGATDKSGTQGTVFVRMIDAKGTLFQLQFAQKGDVENPPQAYTAFLASLKIR
jgi:hypothetical protein